MPGLVDTHIHAAQYSYAGTGLDLPLLEWLNTYTFPAESRFKDLDFANNVYTKVVVSLPMDEYIDTRITWVANRFVGGSCEETEQKNITGGYVNPVTRFLILTEKDLEKRNNHCMLLCNNTHRRLPPAVPDYK